MQCQIEEESISITCQFAIGEFHAYLVYGPPLSSSSKTSTFIDDLNGVDLPLHLRIVGGRTMPTSTITPLNFHYQPNCPASSSPRPSNLVFLLFFIAFFGINCYISNEFSTIHPL